MRTDNITLFVAVFMTVACVLLLLEHRKLAAQQLQLRNDFVSQILQQPQGSNIAGINTPLQLKFTLKPHFDPQKKAIFLVTPTYTRKSQFVDLTRMSHTLLLASQMHNILWIVIEDSETKTQLVTEFLERCGVSNAHFNIKEERIKNRFKANTQRNMGIDHIISLNPHPESVVYFADDDNGYSLDLFDELAKIKQVGIWPVAYSGARRAEFPIVKDGKVTGFSAWTPSVRKDFPVDMASFAVSVKYFLRPMPVKFEVLAPASTGEVRFLKATGITWSELEPLADQCTKILVWHVKTYCRSEDKYDSLSHHIRDV